MTQRFEGKSVFITGASSGIGAALAKAFALEGARVALLARRTDKLEEVKREIEARAGQAIIFQCDVTDADGLKIAAEETVEAFGGIDVVLANAGFGVSGPFENLSVEDWRHQFEVNVFGLINTVYATLPALKESKGRLGLLGSVAGKLGMPMTSPYNASKFTVVGLAECLYHEFDEVGVSVTCINPGFIESEIRSVNNNGVYTGNPDPVPGRFIMPAETAARLIVDAMHKRRPELILTRLGKLAVLANRLSPALTRWTIRHFTRGKLAAFQKKRRSVERPKQ
jgi:short-subunit dehydrogenase